MEKILSELVQGNAVRNPPPMRQWYRSLLYFPPAIAGAAALQWAFGAPFVASMVALYAMQIVWVCVFREKATPDA